MTSRTDGSYCIRQEESHWSVTYAAMAGPCEILLRCKNRSEVERLASLSFIETQRIERKFSRYRDDNIVYKINNSCGKPVAVDEEFAAIINYVDQCYNLSGGLFDITSGILRKAWKFAGEEITPDDKSISTLRKQVGWWQTQWDGSSLALRPGMEIDLGGVCKEYAVDKVAEALFQDSGAPLMVNFGGDIRAVTSEKHPTPWIVGIEDPEIENRAIGQIELSNGAVATSGDAKRFAYIDGVRMGHILDPRTGWPIKDAPRSVTVIGASCVEAGFIATLAMLQGAEAEIFLKEQDISYHCIR